MEIEVKFFLPDAEIIRNRILDLGAENQGKLFESNFRFEDNNNSLIKKKSLLRLRKDQKVTLTFKSEPPINENQFKIHNEWEVEVSDFNCMRQILESLGFHKAQIYEKWRETFVLTETVLCLDTMPFGDFLEIEGDQKKIKDLANRLDLLWKKRILLNYLAIFEILKRNLKLPFTDITFSNFTDVKIDLKQYLHLLEAGDV